MDVEYATGMDDENDEYSDYDSEDEYYSEEENINPYGTRTTKERIRRRGNIPLNLTSDYGRRSGWGVREGIRELLQNLYPSSPIFHLILVLIMFARMTMAHPGKWNGCLNQRMEDGSRHISLMRKEHVLEQIHGRSFAIVKSLLDTLSIGAGIVDLSSSIRIHVFQEEYGQWDKHPRAVANITLAAMVLSIFAEAILTIFFIGEGMKVGIIALLRHRAKVSYYTNREIWDWCFHDFEDPNGQISNLLTIKLAPYQPKKAKLDTFITEDTREARRTAKKDTTVIVQGYYDLDIRFNDYLFLVNPLPETLLETKFGSILTGNDYRFKIFVKGIYVDQRDTLNPPILAYGVNFSKVALDRDRRSVMTESQAAKTLSEMWNDLIERDQGNSVEKYLELLVGDRATLETLEAGAYITEASGKKLFEKLKSNFPPGTFFFNAEDKNIAEVIPSKFLTLITDYSYHQRLSTENAKVDPAKIIRNLSQIRFNHNGGGRTSPPLLRRSNCNPPPL